MNELLQKIVFYVIVGLPSYALIFYGLKGLGYLPVTYGSGNYYNPTAQSFDTYGFLTTYTPAQNIAPYFLIIGVAMLTGLIMRAIVKYSDEDLGVIDMLLVTSDYHEHHCERTAFLVYAGIGAIVAALIITIYFSAQFGQNLLMLFGISMAGGVAALMWYRKENSKFPFS